MQKCPKSGSPYHTDHLLMIFALFLKMCVFAVESTLFLTYAVICRIGLYGKMSRNVLKFGL